MKNVGVKVLVILIILTICLISFIGIYKKGINIIPEYKLSMALNGAREVILEVSDHTKELIYDQEGNITEDGKDEEGNLKEGYTKENVKVNKDEILTIENFKISKKIVEKRLRDMKVSEFEIRQNDENGTLTINLPENEDTDSIISNLTYKGKFEIVDHDTGEVLLDNSLVKESKAVYNTTEAGTTVYLSIEFNKEGKKKLEEVTKTYIQTINEEGEDETKKIAIKLDDEELLETYFGEPITSGYLQLSIGTATTDSNTIADYAKQASQIATLITNTKMEIEYEVSDEDTYLASKITKEDLQVVKIVTTIIIVIAIIFLCAKYKLNGLFAGVGYIGCLALLLLILRYTNVVISLEGIVGIFITLVINYIFTNYALSKFEKDISKEQIIKDIYIHYFWILLPILIASIVFSFTNWLPISSLGMIMFWGLFTIIIYNYLILKTLLDK